MSKKVLEVNPLLYNITLKINQELAQSWLSAMKEDFLPKCTDGRVIVSTQINQLMIDQEDEDLTFAVQFIFTTKEIFQEEGLRALDVFLKLMDGQFRGKYVYFTTKMEILHSFEVPSEN